MKTLKVFLFFMFVFALQVSAQKNVPILELEYPDSLHVVIRADWGWVPLTDTMRGEVNTDKPPHEIKYITVHHAGEEFYDQENVLQKIRNLQSWSRSEKHWIDIPYHFMIDLEGNIYEARPLNYPGDTNTEYNPFGHALVEVMGNYEIQEPNKAQLNSLINFITFLAEEFDVPVEDIKTHKDYSGMTVCPGKNLYKYFEPRLPEGGDGFIISSVKEKLNKKQ